jgi:hypothetical protein
MRGREGVEGRNRTLGPKGRFIEAAAIFRFRIAEECPEKG